jgi:hypothetical protein
LFALLTIAIVVHLCKPTGGGGAHFTVAVLLCMVAFGPALVANRLPERLPFAPSGLPPLSQLRIGLRVLVTLIGRRSLLNPTLNQNQR